MRVRRLAGAGLTAGAFLVMTVVQAPLASAHAQIVTSTPADRANLDAAPSSITLVMSEAVELRFTKLTITDGSGHQMAISGLRVGEVPKSPSASAAESTSAASGSAEEETPVAITADLPQLSPDVYRISWTTLSSDDLHTTSGVIVFGVQRAVPARAAAPADPAPGPVESALRWVALIGVGAAVGAAVLGLLLARRRGASPDPVLVTAVALIRRRLIGLAAAGAGAAALADAVAFLLRAHDAGSGWLGSAGQLLDGSYGVRWIGREVAAGGIVLLCLLCLLARRGAGVDRPDPRGPYRAVIVLGTGYACAVALTGHAGADASGHPVRVAVETLHVLSAITWVGGLVVAAVVMFRPGPAAPSRPYLSRAALAWLRRGVLRRYGLVAASCLSIMAVTGLLLAGQRVASLDALVYSTYGRVLLLKLVLTGLALSAAAATALRVHPDVVPLRALPWSWRCPCEWCSTIEAVAALLVLGAAATLASAQPANGRIWSPQPRVTPIASATAQGLVETVQVAPNQPGRNFVTLDVYDSRRPTPAPISGVELTMTSPDGGRTATEPAIAQGGGRWLVATQAFTAGGRWTMAVTVTRAGMAPVSQGYGWVVADPAGATRAVVISDQPLKPVLDRAAGAIAVVSVLLALGIPAYKRGRRAAGRERAALGCDAGPDLAAERMDTAATSASPSPVPGSSPRA